MSDFQFKVGGDFSELLRGFQQLETRAKTAGDNVGKGIGDGIQGFSSKSLAALNQELNRLQQRQLKVAVDSSAFEKAGAQIKEVQALISAVQRQQVLIQVDDRSVTALQTKLADLQSRQVKVDVDSQEFIELQRQINATEKELQEISQRKVLIDADANSFLAVTAKLRNELNGLQERQLKIDVDSQEFVALGKEIDRVEGELQALERKRTAVTIDASSIEALQAKLTDLQTRQTKVSVDSQEFADLQVQINNVQRDLAEVEQNKILINVDGNSITALTTKLKAELTALEQRRVTIDVDSQEFIEVSQQIDRVEGELQALERKKLLINADPSSIIALRSRLGELQGELEKTQIGSQRFRELQGEINKTETELREATQSAGGLRGVIQQLGPAIAAIGIGTGLVAFTQGAFDAATAAESAEVRIKALGDQFGEADKVQQLVAKSAQQLNLSNTEAADGFLQLYGALRPVGIGLDDVATVFTAVNATAKNFGLSAGNVNAAVLQLSQGLAAGALQGDELRSIMEQLPPVSQAIAKELGVTVGQVKKLGSEGKITSEVVINAIKGLNDTELGKLDQTLNTTQEKLKAQGVAWNELSVTVGSAFVQASLPAIELLTGLTQGLTSVARAAADAPLALKALAGVLLGLPAAYIAARLALIAFNSELIGGQIKAAIAGIQQLGLLLRTQFIADLATAKGAWVAFSTSIQTGALQQQIVALGAKFGPLALAIGAVTAAVVAFNKSTADSQSIAKAAADGQDELTAALTAAGVETSKLTTLGGPFARGLEDAATAGEALLAPLRAIPGIGPLVADAIKGIWQTLKVVIPGLKGATEGIIALINAYKGAVANANATQGLEQAAIALTNLQSQAGLAENAAGALFAELKKAGGKPNTAQTEQIEKLVTALEKAKAQGIALAEQYDLLAAAARNSGNDEYAEELERLAEAARNGIPLTDVRIQQLQSLIPETQKATQATKEQEAAVKARAEAEAQLNKIIAEAPVRNLDAQLAVGQQLVGLSKALADQEQSRFAVVKAGLEFELSKAQERGASESQIGEIKSRIQEQDRQSLEARYQALIQQQQLEAKLLELSQQKARTEADLSVFEARKALLQAEVELKKLSADASTEERAKAEAIVELQRAALGVNEERLGVLAQTQPLERQIAAATAETARNGLQAQAAQAGFNIEADGSVTKTAALAAETSKVKQAAEARKKVEQEIGEVIKQSSLRLATEQLSVAEKLVSLSRALAAEEQSRFDLVRSNLEYELQKAEERGASESEIGSIKERIQKVDRAAAEARYKALLQQQQLEAKMLEIAQRKQVLEANVEFRKQQLALLEAQKKLQEAIAAGDQGAIALARSQVGLQQLMLSVRGEQLGLLAQTQPLEAQILAAQQSAAINAERARAAQNGYQLAAAQSAVNLGNVASIAGGLNNIAAGYAQNLGAAATQAGQLEGAVSDAQSPADGIADAFTTTGDRAPAAAQGARDFAAWLSSAKTFAERIAGLSLDTQMATVATRTAQAAGAAKVFYEWLERASRLPGSRWTGGPVEAGEQYRVNELGQEALLSGGRLSLINAAPNSIWRAPTNGTVIPAGITSRLQDQGALPSRPGTTPIMTSGSSNAALAVEVGKLRQEVGELARKNWNVNVAMKTGPTGSQVIRQMMR